LKIQLLSDLHLEVHPRFAPTPAPGADLLVLAGDVGSYQANSQITDSDFGLARFSPRQGWPTPVLFIPGNHEYDMLEFDATHTRLRETCERLGLTWLEREVLLAADVPGLNAAAAAEPVRFIGTTLWSDFDALGPVAGTAAAESPSALQDQLKARDKAFRAANFYLKKAGTTRFGALMLAEQMRDLSLTCIDWLRAALAMPFDGQTIAVTHFAPSLKSADPRYGMTPGTAGFCSNLDELFAHADLWLHGHLHCPSDYRVGRCHVVANPMGYARKNEQSAFQPQMLLTL
jgi:predicted phosphodiesterase